MCLWLYIHVMSKLPELSPAGAHFHPTLATAAVPPRAREKRGGAAVPAGVLFERLQKGVECRILDVRTGPEFEGAHLRHSVNQPLDQLNPSEWLSKSARKESPDGEPIGALYVLCQAGGRAGRAGQILEKAGVPCFVVEGGLDAWTAAGYPVERGVSRVLPLMRQVQIAVGLVSGAGAALALLKDPRFAWIPLCMGAGLLFAGLSGTCGLALVLARMPWNRRAVSGGGEAVEKSGGSCCGAGQPGVEGGGR